MKGELTTRRLGTMGSKSKLPLALEQLIGGERPIKLHISSIRTNSVPTTDKRLSSFYPVLDRYIIQPRRGPESNYGRIQKPRGGKNPRSKWEKSKRPELWLKDGPSRDPRQAKVTSGFKIT